MKLFTNRFIRLMNEDPGTPGTPPGTPGTPPPAAPAPLLAAPGTPGTEPWFHSLDESVRTNPYVAQSKDLASFVKSAIDTKSMVGANTIKLPGENASDDDRANFYKQLGRPDSADGYKATVAPANEALFSKEIQGKMFETFHKAGLSAAQGQAIVDGYMGLMNSDYEAMTTANQTRDAGFVTELKNEWGTNFEGNLKTAQLAAREFGGVNGELIAVLNEAGLGSNPQVLKFLHQVGTKLIDDSAIGGGEGASRFMGTQEGAIAEINRLKIDANFMKAWGDKQAPGHDEAVARWLTLHEQAYPKKQAQAAY